MMIKPPVKQAPDIKKAFQSDGFTLIEIVASISISALILAGIVGAVSMVSKNTRIAEASIEQNEGLRGALRIINAQMNSIVPYTRTINGEKSLVLVGNAKELTFVSTYSLWGSQHTLVQVSYIVSSREHGVDLAISESHVGEEQKRSTVALKGFFDIGFSFFSRPDGDQQGQWQEEWKDSPKMPEKIRISIKNHQADMKQIITIPDTYERR